MVSSGQLATLMAEATGVPVATVVLFMRILREGGLIATGARGVNARRISYVEAARLLIALMITDKPAKAVEVVQDFGTLEVSNVPSAKFDPLWKRGGLHKVKTFENAIAALLQLFAGDWEAKDFQAASPNFSPLGPMLPILRISIDVDTLCATVEGKGLELYFNDPWLLAANRSQPRLPLDVSNLQSVAERDLVHEFTDAHFAKSKKYLSKIRTERSIHSGVIADIAVAMGANNNLYTD